MSSRPAVQDIQTYLVDKGWQRQPRTWNDALIWYNTDGCEVLVPSSDDLADTDLRVAEILSELTAIEGRPADEIAGDINTPFDDIQLYRTFPGEDFMSLGEALLVLRSVRDLISAAARTVVDGPRPFFPGGPPGLAAELLRRIQLGPDRPADHFFTVRIPLNPALPENGHPQIQAEVARLGRQVGHRLRAAVIAAQSAAARAAEQDLSAFDESVAAGVSANLCKALSRLAGRQHAQPFEIAFRWGRGLPSDVPADTVRFPGGAGAVIQAGALRLRQLIIPEASTITGLVESLHGESPNTGWRIKVRGDLLTSSDVEIDRLMWVGLDSQAAYDQAIVAHRSQQRVRARGEMSITGGAAELVVHDDNFEILERNA